MSIASGESSRIRTFIANGSYSNAVNAIGIRLKILPGDKNSEARAMEGIEKDIWNGIVDRMKKYENFRSGITEDEYELSAKLLDKLKDNRENYRYAITALGLINESPKGSDIDYIIERAHELYKSQNKI